MPTQTLPFDPLGPGGGGVCPSLAAKGRRNRLVRFINSRATSGRASGRRCLISRRGLIVNRGQSFFLAVSLALALLTNAPARADNSHTSDLNAAHGSGLACFSIVPPDVPTSKEAPTTKPAAYPTCDQLCAAKHAACTATTSNMNPMRSCSDTYYTPGSTLCQCCAVQH